MNQKPVADELLSLIKQTEEQVAYFQELGVSGVALETVFSAELPKRPPSRSTLVPGEASAGTPTTGRVPGLAQSTPRVGPAATSTEIPRKIPAPSLPGDVLFGDLRPPAVQISRSGETMEQIWADIGNCTRCPLHEGRTHIVHTEGNQKARLMFVGQLLTKIIESIGFKREEVLIGNINRCRPPGNRAPLPDEVAMCKPYLLREIAAVRPEVIVVMGNTAMKNLLDVKEGITKLRGMFQDYQGIKIMPTFHPAYLLRDPSKKRETWEDLKKVRDYLDSTAKR